jgi:hypothetical protein
MNLLKLFRNKGLWAIMIAASVLTACSDDDDDDDVAPVTPPPAVNEEEVITTVRLIFSDTNQTNPSPTVIAVANDPDGDGPQELQILDSIVLKTNTSYFLTYQILNEVDPNDVEDIAEEIEEEDDEHQFFYGFTNNAFNSPSGRGNIAPNTGSINYLDEDSDAQDGSGNPVGLTTLWTTRGNTLTDGQFRVILMHQPDIKSSTTTTNDGEDDFDLTFELDIEN